MTDPPQPASAAAPSAAFEELLVRAIELFEVEGHGGVQRLFAAHPDDAFELCRKLHRLHGAGLLRGWAGWLPASRPPGEGDSKGEPRAGGPPAAIERPATPDHD
jgi:hypothetical protein